MANAKKAHLVKASVLNAAADEKGANFYVIAASVPEVDKNIALASFQCGSCSTHFSAVKDSQPFCVTCGSEDVDVDSGDDALEAEDLGSDEDLANVECSACGTHNIVTLTTASALGTKMHCVTCGTEIEYMPPSDNVGMSDGDIEEDVEDVEVSADADAGDDESELDDAEVTLTDDLEETSAEGEDDTEEGESEKDEVEEEAGEKDSAETDSDESADDDAEVDSEEATLAAIAQGDLSVERIGDRIVAFVGGIPVGHLTREKAGDNTGVFASTSFTNAIKHTARQIGAEKALAHYKFELATVKFPVPAIVEARVKASVEDAQKEIAARIKDVSADLRQSMSIAAAGLNKGWFKGQPHVLKEAFKNELAASGFKGAARVVDKVFAQYSDPYHKFLFEKAQELLSKPVEFRNELASAIGDMAYQVSNADMDEDDADSDEDQTLESRLEGASLRRTGKATVEASLDATDLRSTVVELRSRNGGRLF